MTIYIEATGRGASRVCIRDSPNQTIARYSLFLSDYSFEVEWVPEVKMIADPLSRMVLLPAGKEAMSLPEICFGEKFGKPIHADKSGGKALNADFPLLFYVPLTEINLCEDIRTEHQREEEQEEEDLLPVSTDYVELDMLTTAAQTSSQEAALEKPLLTKSEEIKLQALKLVRQFLTNGSLPQDKILARAARQLASQMLLE
ncbi:hypothetical protein EV426DRAFT_716995 [Tirmania nivea]|nr:hypothetical protein EV426DRAFT_716995 [Tirmania nivea]